MFRSPICQRRWRFFFFCNFPFLIPAPILTTFHRKQVNPLFLLKQERDLWQFFDISHVHIIVEVNLYLYTVWWEWEKEGDLTKSYDKIPYTNRKFDPVFFFKSVQYFFFQVCYSLKAFPFLLSSWYHRKRRKATRENIFLNEKEASSFLTDHRRVRRDIVEECSENWWGTTWCNAEEHTDFFVWKHVTPKQILVPDIMQLISQYDRPSRVRDRLALDQRISDTSGVVFYCSIEKRFTYYVD